MEYFYIISENFFTYGSMLLGAYLFIRYPLYWSLLTVKALDSKLRDL